MKRSSQSGNVIFIILIAVALLAALSFAVSQGGRGNVSKISEDKARLVATEIIEYANVVANAVAQTRLRGFSDTQISFENNVVNTYTNANCGDNLCKIFHVEGGGVNTMQPPNGANNGEFWIFSDDMEVENVGTTCAGDACTDLTIQLRSVSDAVCQKLNDLLGISDPDTLPVNPDNSGGVFTGSYSYVDTIGDVAGSAKLAGAKAGCFTSTGDSYNVFYRVLIAR